MEEEGLHASDGFAGLARVIDLVDPDIRFGGPTRPRTVAVATGHRAAGRLPDLDIVADILVNREYALTWSDANGDPIRTITTGTLKVRLTNPDNGVSILRNISGPGTTTFHEDGSSTLRARGTWFFFFFADQLGARSPPMSIVNTGTIVIDTFPDGTQAIRSHTGQQEDVCATLS